MSEHHFWMMIEFLLRKHNCPKLKRELIEQMFIKSFKNAIDIDDVFSSAQNRRCNQCMHVRRHFWVSYIWKKKKQTKKHVVLKISKWTLEIRFHWFTISCPSFSMKTAHYIAAVTITVTSCCRCRHRSHIVGATVHQKSWFSNPVSNTQYMHIHKKAENKRKSWMGFLLWRHGALLL